jgi:hypothetical protein
LIKTFKQLQDDVLRWLDEVDDTDTIRENVKQALNAAHQRRLSKNWSFMRWPEPVRFSTVVGQRSYALHQEFHKALYFYNVTAKRSLTEVTRDTIHQLAESINGLDRFVDGGTSWLDATGSAERFELRGHLPVQAQPTAASTLTISSSSTADTNKQALVRGETASGIEEETLTTGASGAAASGSVQFTKILSVTKLGQWAGTMTIVAGAVTVLKLFASEQARFYRQLYLFNEPTAAEEIEYDFYRQIQSLENDNDIPQIPPPFTEILTYDALLDLTAYTPVEGGAKAIWEKHQADLERGMEDTYLGPQTINAAANYIHYVPRD